MNKMSNWNANLYMVSIAFSSVASGIFSLVYNLHITSIMDNKFFLSNFFLIGNISMALGGAVVGGIIDKYDKKNILILATFFSALLFTAECFLKTAFFLYFVSILYGVFYSLLMSIHTPFIMSFVDDKKQPYILNISSSIRLVAYTIGTIVAGYIPTIEVGADYGGSIYIPSLMIAAILYFASVAPLLGIKSDNMLIMGDKDESSSEDTTQIKLFSINFMIPFFLLGVLLFFSPYTNLYLRNRYGMDLRAISMVLAIMEVFPAFASIIIMRLCRKVSVEKIVRNGCIIGVILYVLLAVLKHVFIQVILLIMASILSSLIFPQISRIIIKRFSKKHMGTISGFANSFYNLGDAMGSYIEGVCINNGVYIMPFCVAALIYVFFVVTIESCIKEQKFSLIGNEEVR